MHAVAGSAGDEPGRCPHGRVFSDRGDLKEIAGPGVAGLERSGRQLDDGKGAQRHSDAPGGTAWRTLSTRPSFATNATSIAKRMEKV